MGILPVKANQPTNNAAHPDNVSLNKSESITSNTADPILKVPSPHVEPLDNEFNLQRVLDSGLNFMHEVVARVSMPITPEDKMKLCSNIFAQIKDSGLNTNQKRYLIGQLNEVMSDHDLTGLESALKEHLPPTAVDILDKLNSSVSKEDKIDFLKGYIQYIKDIDIPDSQKNQMYSSLIRLINESKKPTTEKSLKVELSVIENQLENIINPRDQTVPKPESPILKKSEPIILSKAAIAIDKSIEGLKDIEGAKKMLNQIKAKLNQSEQIVLAEKLSAKVKSLNDGLVKAAKIDRIKSQYNILIEDLKETSKAKGLQLGVDYLSQQLKGLEAMNVEQRAVLLNFISDLAIDLKLGTNLFDMNYNIGFHGEVDLETRYENALETVNKFWVHNSEEQIKVKFFIGFVAAVIGKTPPKELNFSTRDSEVVYKSENGTIYKPSIDDLISQARSDSKLETGVPIHQTSNFREDMSRIVVEFPDMIQIEGNPEADISDKIKVASSVHEEIQKYDQKNAENIELFMTQVTQMSTLDLMEKRLPQLSRENNLRQFSSSSKEILTENLPISLKVIGGKNYTIYGRPFAFKDVDSGQIAKLSYVANILITDPKTGEKSFYVMDYGLFDPPSHLPITPESFRKTVIESPDSPFTAFLEIVEEGVRSPSPDSSMKSSSATTSRSSSVENFTPPKKTNPLQPILDRIEVVDSEAGIVKIRDFISILKFEKDREYLNNELNTRIGVLTLLGKIQKNDKGIG